MEKNDDFRKIFNALCYVLYINYHNHAAVMDSLWDSNPIILYSTTSVSLEDSEGFKAAYKAYERIAKESEDFVHSNYAERTEGRPDD